MRDIEKILMKDRETDYQSPKTKVIILSGVEFFCESAGFENYEEEDFVW